MLGTKYVEAVIVCWSSEAGHMTLTFEDMTTKIHFFSPSI